MNRLLRRNGGGIVRVDGEVVDDGAVVDDFLQRRSHAAEGDAVVLTWEAKLCVGPTNPPNQLPVGAV